MKNLWTILFLGLQLLAFGQRKTLNGYVKDAQTGEAIIGAKIYDQVSSKGTFSNEYGFYSLDIAADSFQVRVLFAGYKPMEFSARIDSSYYLDIPLVSADSKVLNQVNLSAALPIEEQTQMSQIELSMEKVKALPVFLGEKDILKTLQLYPGIQSGSEGASGLYVRGGGPDQNLILLDGVPVYNASHLFGFFSVFNADAINHASVIKGGFPAQYGGRLSSVIDIRMKEGNTKKFSGEGTIGLISSKLTLEGPIIKDKTSFIVSGRRTYIDILAQPFLALANGKGGGKGSQEQSTGGYYFWDLNAKLNHKFSRTSRLFVSGYFGKDRFYNTLSNEYTNSQDNSSNRDESSNGLDWGNAIAAVRWNKILSPKLFMNVTSTYSQYRFNVGIEQQSQTTFVNDSTETRELAANYLSGIRDWGLKADFDYRPVSKHNIKFGLGNIYHTFIPGVNQIQVVNSSVTALDSTFGSNYQYGNEHYVYINDEWEVNQRLNINAGLHLSAFLAGSEWYPSIQPRLSGRYMLTETSSLKASYSRMTQFLHLLTNPTIGLPTDLWVPVTERVAPEYSNQFALGYATTINKLFQVSAEVYYKDMTNLIEYKEGSSFFEASTDWQDKITVGKGNSYGLELLLEKKVGKTTGWIGYTLSWTNRQFDSLNFGQPYPYIYDRRHDIGLAITHKFNDKVDVGLVWVYGTGNATTLAQQTYLGVEGLNIGPNNPFTPINYLESRNDYRMPSYHRLDVGVNCHKKFEKCEQTWSFGLYNAYSRQNPFFLYFQQEEDGTVSLNQLSLFPVLPSISYSLKF